MSEDTALILGVLLTLGLIVTVGLVGLKVLADVLGVRIWRSSDVSAPPRPGAVRSWIVNLSDGDHRVEVRADLDFPLLVYCDDVAIPLGWHGVEAAFDISGHEGRLVRRIALGSSLLSGMLGGGPVSAFDLLVDGRQVRP